MTTATFHLSGPLPAVRKAPAKGFFARFMDALIESRMRKAMREIEQYRHLTPANLLKSTGYQATANDDSAFPFTR